MQNSFPWSARKSASVTETRKTRKNRRSTRLRRTRRGTVLTGAIIAVGALVGNGLVLQPALAAQSESIAATAALAASTGSHAEQLDSYDGVLRAHAEKSATATLTIAKSAMTAAKGKSDATALTASVASLAYFPKLYPEQIFELVDNTKAETATLTAATAVVDRTTAQESAAEAAAKAAADAAAAQAAAAKAAEAVAAAPAASASRPSAPTNPSGAQAIARDLMASKYGWGADQFGCLVPLWDRESGWDVNAYNSSSGATGIPQALPGSKMATAGSDWQTSAATQITWGLGYIADRYGTPCAAWDHSESVGWY